MLCSLSAQDFRIVAIDERPGHTMSADLFATADNGNTVPGSLNEAVRKYMPDGTAPASVTTFVMFAGSDIVLFDAGLGNELWEQKLTEIGVTPKKVSRILLTHTHGDHIGGLMKGDERRFPNAEIRLSREEFAHWMPFMARTPIGMQEAREQFASTRFFEAYISPVDGMPFPQTFRSDIWSFNFGDIVFENAFVKVTAKDASGHTPGHTVFLIETKEPETERSAVSGQSPRRLLIVGDLLHAAALQFPVPEACARFDRDMEKAVIARKRILDFAAENNIPIAGMHFPPPSIGTVRKDGNGGYVFELKGE